MDPETRLDDIRRQALNKIERSERDFKIILGVAAVVEGVCLIAFLLLMDFGERLHWLMLVMAVLIYGTLGIGLMALGAYTRHWILRVMTAIEQSGITSEP